MTTVLITGKDGQVGRALCAAQWPNSYHIKAYDRHSLDVTSSEAVIKTVTALRPDLIINAAAFTAVDLAEEQAELAFAVNDLSVGNLAQAAHDSSIPIIHFSTDYVFDGDLGRDYREDDATNPQNVYGQSKLQGEQRLQRTCSDHVILRTSCVFDAVGTNFVRTIFNAGVKRGELTVVADQTCGPTWSVHIAEATVLIALKILGKKLVDPWGVYHFSSKPSLTWFDFTELIFDVAEKFAVPRPVLHRIAGADYAAVAKRPSGPSFDCSKFQRVFSGGVPDLEAALTHVVAQLCEKT
ncbi:MAG: dTDP-4-dehydrorhamnose reductase [Gammaproteobacteria bacterium]|jgi:dTDP-4-dehydrorhamnose reductase